jgi:hypothetical protein
MTNFCNVKSLILNLLLISTLLFFCSCNDPDIPDIPPHYGDGVFILNEGGYMHGNSTLSYYDKEAKTVENEVFFKKNGYQLGDQAQSITIYGNLAYITVCNDGKIYAIDKNTFEFQNKITGLFTPRYMNFLNASKVYVSDIWGKCMYVVNPQTYKVLNTISLDAHDNNNPYQHSSEEIIVVGNLLFTNSWNYDNKILVINAETDQIIDLIEVLVQPKKMVLDKNNNIWVLCDGNYDGASISSDKGIVKINTQTRKVEQIFLFDNQSATSEYIVNDMKINGLRDTIYYINRDVFMFSIYDSQLPSMPYISSQNSSFYGLGIDPSNSDLYVSDAVDYMQNGVVYRFNSQKQLIDEFTVGINPNSFVFK